MAFARQHANLPTVAELMLFIEALFPTRAGDVPFLYHKPFSRSFDASSFTISSIVLSITPTPAFYAALHSGIKMAFLHRPFTLERREVPRLATVLSNHKGFDEVLTVGTNFALAERLGLDVKHAAVIQGYKGDPERMIGIVAAMKRKATAHELKSRILQQFHGSFEGCFGFEGDGVQNQRGPDETIQTVAIMNAFHVEEVDKVIETAREQALLKYELHTSSILYLTGAVREPGLKYALDKGLKIICVGHRTCEEWGISFMATSLRLQFPNLRVEEVYEEEEPRPTTRKGKRTPETLTAQGE